MFKEKIVFSTTPGSCFTPAKTSSLIFSQIQSSFDFSKHPREKPPNTASQIIHGVTTGILDTFKKCNPQFTYNSNLNPKRCLTIPSDGVYNNGYDNENNEYILLVNDIIRSPENEEYVILELLGKGTFGQVIRCLRKSKNDHFAIKVIKNKPAYTNQALMEVKIFKKLKEENPLNEHYIVRLFDYFVFRNHICLVFEMLHVSLYDLLKLSNFSGFSLKFIARLSEQIVESLICLERNRIIHCDIKPENILFADEESDAIKLIDLGSACFTHNTLYTYIQSRFYRAPEVIIGSKYTNKIDSWSFGCMVAEFYLGLPIFPGSSEYDQLRRIIEVIGMPEDDGIEYGRFKNKFFKKENGTYVFKTPEEFEQEQNVKLPPHKKYFILKKLDDLEMYYNKSKQREKQPQEKQKFPVFLHFLKGLLHINPSKRWTSAQAKTHPFLTNQPFDPNWQPLEHYEALAALEKNNKKDELLPQLIHHDSFDPFNKMAVQGFTAESYRPYIPPDVKDKKEEVKSQSQNVYLLNSQTSSTKSKSKLNPNAAAFGGNTFQIPNINIDTNQNIKQGSHSEPNSARNLHSQHKKGGFGDQNYAYQEEKVEEYNEEQGVFQGPDQTQMQDNGNQWKYNKQHHQYQQQYTPNKDYRENYNPSQQSYHEQYYPQGQYGYGGGGYYQTEYSQRQRSHSDQGANENIFFQQKRHQGKHYHQGNKKGYQNYNNNQGQGMNQNQNQEQFGGGNRNKWSSNSGYKNKYGNKNYYPKQHDEQHEERKER